MSSKQRVLFEVGDCLVPCALVGSWQKESLSGEMDGPGLGIRENCLKLLRCMAWKKDEWGHKDCPPASGSMKQLCIDVGNSGSQREKGARAHTQLKCMVIYHVVVTGVFCIKL